VIQTAIIQAKDSIELAIDLNKFLQYLSEEGVSDSTITLQYQWLLEKPSFCLVIYSVLVSWVETADIDNFKR